MNKRRIILLLLSVLLIIIVLIGRLMQIQLFQTENFSKHNVNLLKESVKQRTQQIIIDDGRGIFLDASGEPLSHEEKTVLILFPFLKALDWNVEEVAAIIGTPVDILEQEIEKANVPFIYGEITAEQAEKITTLNIPGVISVKRKWMPSKFLASQFIGLTSENQEVFQKRYPNKIGHDIKIGVTGLQSQFDEFLLAELPSKLIYHVDNRGGPLFGVDVKYTGQNNPYYPLNIKTTIDRELQENLEELVDQHEIKKGGALLLDIKTGNIVAIASRPNINWDNPFIDDGTKNMLFEQHIPGSVFKTVVTAAAIDKGFVKENDIFNCNLTIRGEEEPRKLGELNIEESFSRSCNRTFAELAVALQKDDPETLENYAEKLGLIGHVGWQGDVFYMKDFMHFLHSPGRVFLKNENKYDENFVAQTGIGQHEVRVSPVGVANMLALIARGGEGKAVRAASEIQYADGGSMFSFTEQRKKEQYISPFLAQRLQQLLRMVVTDSEGTGAFFQTLNYDVAGKSGTAETGVLIEDKQLYNKWFAGYFPFQNPKYSLVTVNLDVFGNEGSIYPLFADIVNMVYETEEKTTSME